MHLSEGRETPSSTARHKKCQLTSGRVVLETQIDVLGNTETEAASGREVLLLQLVLLHLKGAVQDLVGLEAADLY